MRNFSQQVKIKSEVIMQTLIGNERRAFSDRFGERIKLKTEQLGQS